MTPRLAASSSPIFDGSLPPASAKSGRPPPPPPTIGASCLTTWPAGTFFVRSGVTPTTIETLPSDGRGEDDDAALDLVAMLVDERAQAVLVEAADLARDQLHAGDFDDVVVRAGRAPPGASAAFIFACCSSRASRLFSSCSAPTRATSSPGRALSAAGQAARARRDGAGTPCSDSRPVIASMRRTPAATPLSDDDGEEADVAGGADVRAAAQLQAEARDRHDAHLVAVLLAEQRHRAGRDRLLRVLHLGLHRRVPQDLLVDDALDLE